jgi:hypothetical protein
MWISVKDELPPRSNVRRFSVSVFVTDGEGFGTGYYDFVDNEWIGYCIDPTYWMYIPELPK